jgi:hypothetical protein
VILISAVFERTAQKYGEARTPQYVYLEAGHAAQNILLQAVALDLGAVPIGAFHEDQISQALVPAPRPNPALPDPCRASNSYLNRHTPIKKKTRAEPQQDPTLQQDAAQSLPPTAMSKNPRIAQ